LNQERAFRDEVQATRWAPVMDMPWWVPTLRDRIHCAAWRVATPRCIANSYAYLRKPVEWEDLIERVRPSLGASAAG